MRAVVLLLTAYGSLLVAPAQKIAVLTPSKTAVGETYAEKLAVSLSEKFKVLNSSLSEAAFLSADVEKPFNMTTEEAKIVGAAIGSDFFLLVRSENLTRFSLEKKEYFESYAAVYAVSARTGRLVFWKLQSFTGSDAKTAEKLLFESIGELAKEISVRLPVVAKEESTEKSVRLAEIPADNSPDAMDFRAPLPFRRLSPPYTPTANLYSVAATVDIEVDFDEAGVITRTGIARWAGFGLDESVAETVRRMNWRPATRGGKPLPIRVLLRYNFKKIEKED
ncbi:MAG TPA: energy transducer TonB [Pyrinomonadaceae bacterium]